MLEVDKKLFLTKELKIREDKNKGIYIENLTEKFAKSEEMILNLMQHGNDSRAVAATNMNENSSRSHSIFVMNIQQQSNGEEKCAKSGKLYLVDLAGSEKISKTG